MTAEEKLQLKELLVKMKNEEEPVSEDEPDGRKPGFVPHVCLKEFYKTTRTPFVELIIFRGNPAAGFQYLYQDRHDQWWDGFCAFGGMVRENYPAEPVEVAQKLLNREFKGMDIKVRTLQVVSFLNWPKHPWCNPFAVTCLIQVDGKIPNKTDDPTVINDRHWLSVNEDYTVVPEVDMVMNHRPYLMQCEFFLRNGPLVFTPNRPYGIVIPT